MIGLFLDSTSCWFCNFSSHSSLNKNQVEDFLFENLSHASTTFTFTVLCWASSVIILGYQLVDYQLLLRRCLVSKLEGNGQEGKGDNSIANCHNCPEKNEVCGNLLPTGGLLHPSPSRPAILSGLNVYYMYIVKVGWQSRKRLRKLWLGQWPIDHVRQSHTDNDHNQQATVSECLTCAATSSSVVISKEADDACRAGDAENILK